MMAERQSYGTTNNSYGMDDATYELITTGFLPPRPGGMTCIYCGRLMGIVYEHEPVTPPFNGKKLPGLVWGRDASPVCMCCSFEGCPHKEKEAHDGQLV